MATRQQNRSGTHTRTLLPLSSRVHCFGPYETSALRADSSLSKTDRQCSSTRALMIDKDRFAAISKIQTQLESKREHQLTLQSLCLPCNHPRVTVVMESLEFAFVFAFFELLGSRCLMISGVDGCGGALPLGFVFIFGICSSIANQIDFCVCWPVLC